MSLPPGSTLGPYLLVSPLGSGGMGEVYRARDTRLNREVAVKVLASRLAADTSALVRFEREAQALAALSHPHIVAVYDVGHADDTAYVVMELLEGETLRARMNAGPVPLRKATDYAVPVAHALAAAHDRGIVHRDLKPENIFLMTDGHVKILDFGIAHLASASAIASAETVLVSAGGATGPNLMIGSVGYMAPEQARGEIVDARADIFSLGAVLYEMAGGARAFAGDTPMDVLAATLYAEPPPLDAYGRVPATFDRIVRRCLEKRREDRFQSARDLAFALDSIATASLPVTIDRPHALRWRVPWWTVPVAAAVALLAALGITGVTPPPVDARAGNAVRFTLEANRGAVPEVSVSPNGRYLAWTGFSSGAQAAGLWIRRLDALQPELVPDTPASGTPFWSPDGRELVVMDRDAKLTAIDVERGGRRVLADVGKAALPLRGGDWSGQTLLLSTAGTISTIDLSGRTPRRRITSLDALRESWHGWPVFVSADRFLYTAATRTGSVETRLASLDGSATVRVQVPDNASRMKWDPRGYVVFSQNGALVAQKIDLRSGAAAGSPIRIGPEVLQNPLTAWTAADISKNGVIAWRAPGVDFTQFESVDRAGRTLATFGEPDSYTNFDVSPDGAYIAATRRRGESGSWLFLIDMGRNVTTLVSEQSATAAISDPTFSPDGKLLAYRRGTRLVVRGAFGGEERALTTWPAYPDSWSRDGKYLIVGRPQGPIYELWVVSTREGEHEEIPLVTGLAVADEARFSPDGRWVAFHAAVQATPEVFAIRFPPTGERWQISTEGGVQPRWRSDGRELYYLSGNGQLMSVQVPDGNPTQATSPVPLFNLRLEPSSAFDQFSPSSDGQRFFVRRPLRPGGADTAPVHVLVNWLESVPGPSR